MNMNELYLEVKGKWKSLYPIYFDATKSIKQGTSPPTQAAVYPSSSASKSPPSKNWPAQSVSASCATSSSRTRPTPATTSPWED